MLRRLVTALALTAPLTGCPAFFVDRGELVRPSASVDRPAVGQLPPAAEFVELEERWRRETRIGLGGYAEATLIDPRLAAAMVAHEGAVQSMRPQALEGQLATTWETFYGAEGDRFPIDVTWRFDQQFISQGRILDPAEWQITVQASGREIAPLAVSRLEAADAPQGGYWEGKVRLWFPMRDLESGHRLLGGETDVLTLRLVHRSGSASLSWRFSSVF